MRSALPKVLHPIAGKPMLQHVVDACAALQNRQVACHMAIVYGHGGELVREPEQARLWLYYKPDGLVTSESDEKGRETVFDNLPEDLPRVMSVGRLDLNSEGLLLLTNDGTLKRRLELPSTGWLRKYRVRVNGNPTDPDLEPLRKGIEVEGERFQPMIVILDRIQGANAWLTVGLREGKNREIRRAMSAINLTVNRLIRVSYGPFRLGDLQPGQVEEVKGKVLRDQLGEGRTPEDEAPRKVVRAPRGAAASRTATGSKAETARPKAEREAPRARPDSTKPTRPAKPGSALTELSKAWTVATTAKPRGIAPKKAGVDKPSAPTKPRNTPAAPRSATPGRGKPGPRPKRGE